jgi:hypothetical protein
MSFRPSDVDGPPSRLQIGKIAVRHILWPADDELSPRDAGEQFLEEFKRWLETIIRPT